MTTPAHGEFDVVVTERAQVAEGVIAVTLARRDGDPLPDWELGAHIDLFLPTGFVRQYSLCGLPGSDTWRVAVLREEGGRGGSRWITDRLHEGAVLGVAGPRSHFPFDPRSPRPVVLLAGGIGITPVLPMARAAAAAGREYVLHYAGHAGRMAFVDELAPLHGDRLVLHVSEEGTRADLPRLFAEAAAGGAEVVCCGPTRLIDAALAEGERTGVPVTVERFEATELAAPVWNGPFEVELAMSGMTIEVQPDESMLTALENAGALILSSCTEGTCGTCETVVLEGEVDHRDSILTPAQRARNDTMYVCVSRAACPRLVVDL